MASADMLKVFALVRQRLIDAAIGLVQAENLEPRAVHGLVVAMEDLTQGVEIGLLEAILPSGHSMARAT
ncbi:MAG TPA: hypothetical protein VFI11_15725 [Anaerolineales bacterium]|nr:hypothetical protein [Anaerolineales bacterium]